mmetsp:Transcript_796/g.776  ORF Transcript_796/g.776 Transcript_796/m.776 type:complete len:122 (+) Transcript_796:32-397(+)
MTDKKEKDEVLVAEDEAKQRIQQVQQEKDDLLRQAKDKAKKQLKSHDDELRTKTQEKITELYLDRTPLENIDEKTKQDIKAIDESFVKNKDQVSQFLFDSVTKVNIVIPDVVIANFEEKFK